MASDRLEAAVKALHDEANAALRVSVERIDKRLRSVQRAFFVCGHDCSSDDRPAESVSACVAACQQPMSDISERMSHAQDAFQKRVSRCHELAGESIEGMKRSSTGGPSDAALDKYLATLKPCVTGEVGKLEALLAPVHAALPETLRAIEAVGKGGRSGGGGANTKGLSVGGEGVKKSTWW